MTPDRAVGRAAVADPDGHPLGIWPAAGWSDGIWPAGGVAGGPDEAITERILRLSGGAHPVPAAATSPAPWFVPSPRQVADTAAERHLRAADAFASPADRDAPPDSWPAAWSAWTPPVPEPTVFKGLRDEFRDRDPGFATGTTGVVRPARPARRDGSDTDTPHADGPAQWPFEVRGRQRPGYLEGVFGTLRQQRAFCVAEVERLEALPEGHVLRLATVHWVASCKVRIAVLDAQIAASQHTDPRGIAPQVE